MPSRKNKKMKNNRKPNKQNVVHMDGTSHSRTAPPLTAQEIKYKDTIATESYDTTSTITLLNSMADGVSNTDRVGEVATFTGIQFRRALAYTPTGGGTNVALCRHIILYDKQSNGALPALTDILETATSISPYQLNNRNRFQILYDSQELIQRTGVTALVTGYYKPLNENVVNLPFRLPTVYKDPNSGISSIATGALIAVAVGNLAAASGTTFTMETYYRSFFVDD